MNFLTCLLAVGSVLATVSEPLSLDEATGLELMEAVVERHQHYPYLYEEQSMVLTDRGGQRETRRMRSYLRIEDDGYARYLLVFDSPLELEGVAILTERDTDGGQRWRIYLPALGDSLVESGSEGGNGRVLGTDFSVSDLVGEPVSNYDYVRQRDERIGGIPHFVVDAYLPGALQDDPPVMRHFILKDNLFIVRTDHFDQLGRLGKQQSWHDLRPVGSGAWRANIMRMEDLRRQHSSIIRVERRVFSRDYVPVNMFSPEWLLGNQPAMTGEGGGR